MGNHVNSDPNMTDEERTAEKWGRPDQQEAQQAQEPALVRPAGNASTEEWRAYAASLTGRPAGELEGKTRAELAELADRHAGR